MIVNCEQCGCDVEKSPSIVKRNDHCFCSPECGHKWKRENTGATFICIQCGTVFRRSPSIVKRYKNSFCSNKCNGQFNSKKRLVICETCGKEFAKKRSEIAKSKHHYCSYECKYEADRTAAKMECEYCGETIYVQPNGIAKHKHHFCNRECRHEWRKEQPDVLADCEYCGKTMERSPYDIRTYKHLFCCNECHRLYRIEHGIIAGANNPAWLGGKSSEPYGVAFNSKLKEYVRSRDDYTCQECGATEATPERNLTCHHIDYDKLNNDPDINLISLCISCHGKTVTNRAFWTPYFQGMLVGRQYENAKQLLFPFAEVG